MKSNTEQSKAPENSKPKVPNRSRDQNPMRRTI